MPDKGQRFDEAARPSVGTVQKVARGDHQPPRRRRKRRTRTPEPEITSLRVNAEVWQTALRLAASPKHIQIVSEEEVIVWNHEAPWPGRRAT